MSSNEDVQYLQIPLEHIKLATNGFSDQNIIGRGGFGNVYEGISEKHGRIAIKRLVYRRGQGDREFRTEIALLSKHKHDNIVSLIGFCDEDNEKILVYKYESKGSLDTHLNNQDLTWIQRLWICLHAARGLKYLHNDVRRRERIFHRDVKSANILLDESWNPKISDFGLSRVGSASTMSSFVITNPCGTLGYIDPDYCNKGYLTQKADVYSFGVVLWEVLCGRLANVKDENVDLSLLAEKHHQRKTLDRIIPSYLHKQMNTDSLDKFSDIAYQCLKKIEERPTMKEVVEQLKEALHNQLELMSPDDGKRVEKQANPATGDDEKREESKDPQPPPLPQEFAFQVFMHCDECARKVRKCLKDLDGVEGVVTDCDTNKVVVKGEKADPSKILERIRKETKRKVKLLSPVLTPPTVEAAKKLEQVEPCKPEEKKDEVVKKPQKRMNSKKDAMPAAGDEKKHKVLAGEQKANPLKVQQMVPKKSQQNVKLQSNVPKLPTEEPKKLEQKEPQNQDEKRDDLTSRDIITVFFICIIIIIYYFYKLIILSLLAISI